MWRVRALSQVNARIQNCEVLLVFLKKIKVPSFQAASQRGVFTDSVHGNTDYHVVRDGVDQDQIAALCKSMGFECEIHKYFSTQRRLMQPADSALNLANKYVVVAYR
jgi:hypothetical protein